MKLESTRQLPVSQETAWNALNDLDMLKHCIPGCESLTRNSEGDLEAVVVTKIGPVSARFKGKVTLEDVVAPKSYRLVFAGQGGAAGFAKGEAKVNLEPKSSDETELHYVAEASVGGKLAQVGSRLIESSAKKIAEEFFSRLEAALSAESTQEETNAGDDTAADAQTKVAGQQKVVSQASVSERVAEPNSRKSTYLWVAAVIAAFLLGLSLS